MVNTNQTNTDNQKWFFRGTIKTIKINSDKGVEIKVNYKGIFHTKYFLKYKCLDSSIITAELEEINELINYSAACDATMLLPAFFNKSLIIFSVNNNNIDSIELISEK